MVLPQLFLRMRAQDIKLFCAYKITCFESRSNISHNDNNNNNIIIIIIIIIIIMIIIISLEFSLVAKCNARFIKKNQLVRKLYAILSM